MLLTSLAAEMAFYTRYHRNPWNRACHFVGVPTIVLALMIWLHLLHPTLPRAVSLVLVLHYARDHLGVGVASALPLGLLCALTTCLAATPAPGKLALGLFVVGWIFQLVGHAFEGKKPALVDNLTQVFVAPAFLTAEVLFALGLAGALRDEVADLAREE